MELGIPELFYLLIMVILFYGPPIIGPILLIAAAYSLLQRRKATDRQRSKNLFSVALILFSLGVVVLGGHAYRLYLDSSSYAQLLGDREQQAKFEEIAAESKLTPFIINEAVAPEGYVLARFVTTDDRYLDLFYEEQNVTLSQRMHRKVAPTAEKYHECDATETFTEFEDGFKRSWECRFIGKTKSNDDVYMVSGGYGLRAYTIKDRVYVRLMQGLAGKQLTPDSVMKIMNNLEKIPLSEIDFSQSR